MDVLEELHILGQCLAALVLGGLIGYEREATGKWAGLRTHMLVCLSALLFIRLGPLILADAPGRMPEQILRGDPIRVIEAIATAIAFLGAGTIIRDRKAGMARGLTTAASLFLTAGVAIAIGIDHYIVAVGATLLGLFVLRAMNRLENKLTRKDRP
jgi:putative Mg2+ transporter-C (MgtC) family protein